MNEDNLISKDNERVIDFFKTLDRMLDGIEGMTKNYRPMLNGERYLTDKEVAQRLRLSRRLLQEYRNEGTIPYCKLGGKILYRESDIQRMLEDGYREAFR